MDPGSFRLAFHCSLAVYAVPPATTTDVCTKAAFGLNVPAEPPLSFQPSRCPAIVGKPVPDSLRPLSPLYPPFIAPSPPLPLLKASAPPEGAANGARATT